MGRAQPEQGGGIVNVAVMTGALGYREYNTTLMTMDGWTDSRGTDRHPTVVDERVNVGSFMSGDDHLYADVYCHDDEVERIGANPDPKPEREPEFLVRKKLLDKRYLGGLLYLKVGELVVVDRLKDVLPMEAPQGGGRGRGRRGRPLLGRGRRGRGRRGLTSLPRRAPPFLGRHVRRDVPALRGLVGGLLGPRRRRAPRDGLLARLFEVPCVDLGCEARALAAGFLPLRLGPDRLAAARLAGRRLQARDCICRVPRAGDAA